jgi:protein arginine N-methyltransferase 1
MKAYYDAIMQNRNLFEGKVILDVGTGSGVLSLWAAQAGAAKVYAVEYTDMAHQARKLVEANGMSEIIEVIQSSAEELELPCQVDIIISEWMGYMLLRESMLDSVIRARNKWLKPEGAMFPSHATMLWAAVSFEEDRVRKAQEYADSMADWTKFSEEMKRFYHLDMGALSGPFEKEQIDYYVYSSLWTELQRDQVVGQPVVIKRLNLNTCTLEDSKGVSETPFSLTIPFPVTISGFAGWFTVDFAGSSGSPVTKRVTLSTGPEVGYTHWGQQVFYMRNPIECTGEMNINGTLEMIRQEKNKRLYNVRINHVTEDNEKVTGIYEIP